MLRRMRESIEKAAASKNRSNFILRFLMVVVPSVLLISGYMHDGCAGLIITALTLLVIMGLTEIIAFIQRF